MNITTYKTSEIDIKELAAFMFQVRRAELERRNMSLADLEAKLRGWQFLAYVLARAGDDLIGYALLYQIGESDLVEINPGSLLGHHPITAPGFDEGAVGAGLIEAAQACVDKMLPMWEIPFFSNHSIMAMPRL